MHLNSIDRLDDSWLQHILLLSILSMSNEQQNKQTKFISIYQMSTKSIPYLNRPLIIMGKKSNEFFQITRTYHVNNNIWTWKMPIKHYSFPTNVPNLS